MSEHAARSSHVSAADSGKETSALRELLAVLTLALSLRALHWAALSHLPPFIEPDVDAKVYDALARRIAAGDVRLGSMVLPLAPGYCYVLAGIYWLLGSGLWAFRLVQGALGLLLIACIFDCARRLYGTRWALVAGAIAALYGPYAFFEAVHLGDALGAVLHGLLLWVGVWALAPSPVRFAGAAPLALGAGLGSLWAASALVRPNALLLVLPLVSLLWRVCSRGRGVALAAFAGAGLLVFAPIALRNRAAGDQSLLTSLGGLNLYIGNGPDATGSYRVPHEVAAARGIADQFGAFARAAEQAQGRALTPREVDAYWYARTWSALTSSPLTAAKLWIKKLRLFWNGRDLWDVYDYAFYQTLDRRLLLGVSYAQLAPFALLGTLLLLLAGRPAERWLAAFNLTICLAISLVFVSARFRLPVVAGSIVASVALLRVIGARLRARDARGLALLTAGLCASMAIAWPVRLKPGQLDEEYFKVGVAYQTHGDLRDAVWAYGQSLAHNRAHLPSRFNLARLYEQTGQKPLAIAAWRQVLTLSQASGEGAVERTARARLLALAQAERER